MSVIDEKTFLIYDHTVLKKEEDDLKDAIVYFYPPSVADDTQCGICGQLMGMVDLFKNLMGSPPCLFKLQTTKFAVKHLGQYSVALAATLSCPDGILFAQLDHLFKLFCFYHKSLPTFYKRAVSSNVQHGVWSGYVKFIRHCDDTVSSSFQSLPYIDIPQGKGQMIHLQAKCLLQHCVQHFPVFAGCVFYRNSVLTTQLSTDLTFRLLIIRPKQLSHEKAEENPYPDGTHVLPVYLTQEEYAIVSQNFTYNLSSSPTSHSNPSNTSSGHPIQSPTTSTSSDDYDKKTTSSNDNSTSKKTKEEAVESKSTELEGGQLDTRLAIKSGHSDTTTEESVQDPKQALSLLISQPSSTNTTTSSDSPVEGAADIGGQSSIVRHPMVITSDPGQILENIKAVAARGSETFSRTAVGQRVTTLSWNSDKKEVEKEVAEDTGREGDVRDESGSMSMDGSSNTDNGDSKDIQSNTGKIGDVRDEAGSASVEGSSNTDNDDSKDIQSNTKKRGDARGVVGCVSKDGSSCTDNDDFKDIQSNTGNIGDVRSVAGSVSMDGSSNTDNDDFKNIQSNTGKIGDVRSTLGSMDGSSKADNEDIQSNIGNIGDVDKGVKPSPNLQSDNMVSCDEQATVEATTSVRKAHLDQKGHLDKASTCVVSNAEEASESTSQTPSLSETLEEQFSMKLDSKLQQIHQPTVDIKLSQNTDKSGPDKQAEDSSVGKIDKGDEVKTTISEPVQHTLDDDTMKVNGKSTKTGESSLVPLELYVQNNSEMVVLLLMVKGSKKNNKLVSSMWKSVLPQLADLEAKLQMCPQAQQPKQQEALANYQYLQYNSLKKSLSGRIAIAEEDSQVTSADQNPFCQNAVFIHDTNNKNTRLKEIIMRKPGSIVYGHKIGLEESFFQRSIAVKTTGAPSEKDATMQISKKIREKLYKDQHISLL